MNSNPEDITAQEEELLALLLAEEGIDLGVNQEISPRQNTNDALPLSYTQEGLWFLSQVEPDNPFYNLSAAFSFQGKLDISILKKSLNKIVSRHEILRTHIVKKEDRAVQIINTNSTINLQVINLKTYPLHSQSAEVKKIAAKISQQPFDLANDYLLRFTLLQLAEDNHVLLITIHHIITDGYSWGILIKEIGKCYQSVSDNEPLPFQELSIQYGDYTLWQREQLEEKKLDKLVNYWKQQLAGIPPLLELPCDRPRPAIQSYQGNTKSNYLSPELTQKLKQLSQASNTSLFMTLEAAFAVLLHRYSRQSDIVIGSPIANRNLPELEKLIGFFANNLVLRHQFTEGMTFQELLTQVRQTTLEGYEHQELPFGKMVDELQPERDLSRNPLFQVVLSLQNAPFPSLELPDLNLTPVVNFNTGTARFDLEVNFWEEKDGLKGDWLYSTDLFNAATIDRMMGHFQILLEGIVTNPDSQVSQLPLITRSEYQLLTEWNNNTVEYPRHKCIHQLFEEQVAKTPDAVAVKFEEQELTYKELNQRANQLANYLQTLGIKADSLVGICVKRSLETIVGILGILKAGGAYVPLDISYPSERISFMLDDTKLSVLLTQESLLDALPKNKAKVVCLDRDRAIINQESQANLDVNLTADNLAYLMYTSGSTGKPKGVQVVHRGVVRLVKEANYVDLSPEEIILQLAPISFDASTLEIWGSMLNGGKLILFPADTPSLADLGQIIQQEQITTMWLTASLFHLMVDEQLEALKPLRQLLAGGDVLSVPHVKRFLAAARANGGLPILINGYGPTENTTFTCCYQITKDTDFNNSIPIGRPINNTQVYILDSHLQLVPVGVPGELYVGGDGLARGYLNCDDLTQEKFIPNPFTVISKQLSVLKDTPADINSYQSTINNQPLTINNERLYKTGDLVRYLPDGNIEFLGRIDNQVKIRGFRIELGEIEAAVAQHPNVKENVVILREDTPRVKRIVAYVVLNQKSTSVGDLNHFFKQKLPDYLVPSTFVILDALPLTPNGKCDRKALPTPERINPEIDSILPSTPKEKTLASIWAKVLRLEQVGINENFFELGGDSILGIQIVAQANQAGLKLTVKQLFQYQTIRELATVATSANISQVEQGLVTGKVPLTPIQHWFFEQEITASQHWNMAWLLEVEPNLKAELLEEAVGQLLVNHDSLRLKFTSTASGWQQEYTQPKSNIPFTVINLSKLESNQQKQQIETTAHELQGSLDLASGDLVRVVLFRLGNNKSDCSATLRDRLLLIAHHLVVDGVSWRIILEDLFTAYQQLEQSKTIKLPAKTSSWQAWNNKLTEYAESEALEQELNYWSKIKSSPISNIPLDYPEGKAENTVGSVRQRSVSLTEAQTRALLQEVPAVYNTQINDILLTALVQSLTQWAKTDSLLINLEGHGREELFAGIDLSRTVGWFTSIFPVLLKHKQDSSLADGIKSVKEQLRQVPNKGIGYGILHYLKQTEVTKELPTGEISFNYLGQLDGAFNQGEVLGLAKESFGYTRSQSGKRRYLLEIDSLIVDGKLRIEWNYSQNLHLNSTIESLADNFREKLQALITHCQQPETGGYTPSDFPLTQLNQIQLDRLIGQNRANIEDIYQLSPMQQGMLFHTISALKSGVYFEQPNFTINGTLDTSAFKQAWQQIVARHSQLRTSFYWQNLDKPVQVVYKQIDLPWVEEDWRALNPSEQEQKLQLFLQQNRQKGFELSQSPLMRFQLIRLADDTYHFIWSFHHLLLDGWSLHSLFKEMLMLYQALNKEEKLSLLHPRPYRDYITWLQKQDIDSAEEFWRNKLQGFSAPTPLVVDEDLAISSSNTDVCEEYPFQLSTETTTALKSLAKQHRLTLSTLIQGAWTLLLHRYSGETDIVCGTTVSGRSISELMGVESMVGLFINTLPLRVEVNPEAELLSWLQDIQLKQIEQEEYAYTPLFEVQQWSDVPGGISLFDSILVFENYPVDELEKFKQKSSIAIGKVSNFEQTNYPLMLLVMPEKELSLVMTYDSSRFRAETITRMMGHLQTLLEGMVANPQQKLGELPLITDSERYQLLEEWNDTQSEYPDLFIHQLFEAQVERTPNAVAVKFAEQELTYLQLNERANQLAHYLQTLGVKPDTLIGICCDRSLEMLIGLLGILKSGGAYVPLDPAYPSERIAYMLDDSQVSILLTQEKLKTNLPDNQAQIICLDTDWSLIAQESTINLVTEVETDNLAYVIYTSGSTGKPKGVLIEHRGLSNFLTSMQKQPGLTQSDKLVAVTTISFDIAALELYLPLIVGATVILASREVASNPQQLWSTIIDNQANVMQATPATWRMLLSVGWQYRQPFKILCGGEALPKELAQELLETGSSLWNVYGPTETTIWSAVKHIKSTDDINIGCPLANTQMFILDKHLQSVPIGVPGELYIGGDGLARGYLHRDDLTNERFISIPVEANGGSPLQRIYKTGDLGKYLPNGNIELLGRIDNQVKIRGFRIELGEIESILAQHPDIKQSVVIVREDVPGDKRLVAYAVVEQNKILNQEEIRSFLQGKLPGYMIPSAFVTLPQMPLTPNGKINRKALPKPEGNLHADSDSYVVPQNQVEAKIVQIWQKVLQLDRVGIYDNFFDLGGHSLLVPQVWNKLTAIFDTKISMVDMFAYPTIHTLARHITNNTKEEFRIDRAKQSDSHVSTNSDIAIIGMSCRFPGADNPDKFWQNLKDGVGSITFFEDEELLAAGVDKNLLTNPNYIKAGGFLEDIDKFDAAFFDINSREAEITDPQHRIFLECASQALETSGYNSFQDDHNQIALYAGVGMNNYYVHNVVPYLNTTESASGYQAFIGNDKDFVPTRVSYKLNLKGASLNVNTACSSSLVAVHLACQSLLNGECDMAMAGGVSIHSAQKTGYMYQEGMIMSPDGHCRSFDANAQGTVGGSGAGIVVLKRLQDAIADGDHIEAVIKGSAINNDGAMKIGYTAPSIDGQAAAIAQAMVSAKVEPGTISYIEAHGTATELGDPIEIAALTKAFRIDTDAKQYCAIGSVKSNFGHLDAAAGIAGLIKTVLALKHKQIPPSLHYEAPNPKIDFAGSPFFVNNQLKDWYTDNMPRRAGVSSFGIGGTNAHIVLEEHWEHPKQRQQRQQGRKYNLLLLSTKTATALNSATENLATHLEQNPELNLADVAYTLQVGRRTFNHRRMVVCDSVASGVEALKNLTPQQVLTQRQELQERPVVFMFSGQGSQYINMGRELYDNEPVFRENCDRCFQILETQLDFDLRSIIFPSDSGRGVSRNAPTTNPTPAPPITQTQYAQPAIFIIEYAIAQLWMSWGIKPTSMLGHSIGEYVAACLSGVFSLEDALAIVAQRAKLMQQMPTGAMVAVSLSELEIQPWLNHDLEIAVINTPSACVVSGTIEAIEELEQKIESFNQSLISPLQTWGDYRGAEDLGGIKGITQNIDYRRLHTSHAFHSFMMQPMAEALTKLVSNFELNPPQIPYLSNVTGTWITPEQATSPSYWTQHLCQKVRFSENLEQILANPQQILLEIGAGKTLKTLATRHPNRNSEQAILSSLRHPQDEQSDSAFLMNNLGKLWLAGAKIDWNGFYQEEKRYRIPLPTYPFERQRYWIDAPKHKDSLVTVKSQSLEKKPDLTDWFYLPSWKRSLASEQPKEAITTSDCWLVFIDERNLGSELITKLEQNNQKIITVKVSSDFQKLDNQTYFINPSQADDYYSLFTELYRQNEMPSKILHLWSIDNIQTPQQALEETQDRGFYSLLYLAQALSKQNWTEKLDILTISNNLQAVTGLEDTDPSKATLLAACKVIPQEYPHIKCGSIDLCVNRITPKLIQQIWQEIISDNEDTIVAYRGANRWVQTYESVQLKSSSLRSSSEFESSLEPLLNSEFRPHQRLPKVIPNSELFESTNSSRLKSQGVYLITGGLGGVGLVIAEYLAKTVQAKLILTGRSSFPTKQEWTDWLEKYPESHATSRKIIKLQQLESLGSEVLAISADVANLEQMEQAIALAEQKFGAINGVFHGAGILNSDTFQSIADTSKAHCQEQFQPKIQGLLILEQVLKEKNLDFCLLLSSISSVLGGLGYLAYSAGNIFMDSFTQQQNQRDSTPWITVNWDGWQVNQVDKSKTNEFVIFPTEGMEVLQRILSRQDLTQIVVSTGDLSARLNQWVNRESPLEEPATAISLYSRPNLPNAYVAPRNDIEQTLADIWQEFLGIEIVGVYDDFFELGGDSLIVTRLISRLRKEFQVELSFRSLFTETTIASLGENIATLRSLAQAKANQTLSDEDLVEGEI